MTGEAHMFSHPLLCSHPAHPAPMLLETGFHIQMAGFATQSAMQHEWLDATRVAATRVVTQRRFCAPMSQKKTGFVLQLAGFATQQVVQHVWEITSLKPSKVE